MSLASRDYIDGSKLATMTGSNAKEKMARMSFAFSLRMPNDGTPLRREDFYRLDDFMVGFTESLIDSYENQIKNLYTELNFHKNRAEKLESQVEYQKRESGSSRNKPTVAANSGRARVPTRVNKSKSRKLGRISRGKR